MIWTRKIITVAALFFIFLVSSSTIFAQESSLKAVINISDLSKPVFTLINTSDSPCQILNTSIATIAITQLSQNGQPIKPIPLKIRFDDGVEPILKHAFKTLQPSESVSIPFEVYPYKSDLAIQTIAWSPLIPPLAAAYPIKKNNPYFIEASYTMPIPPTSGPPACGNVVASAVNSFTWSIWINAHLSVLITVGIVLILILILLILFFLRHRKKAKHMLLILVAVTFFASGARPTRAEYTMPPEAGPIFDGCMELFSRYPDITNPILDDIDPETIHIFTNTVHVNDTTDWPDGSYHIRWDATSEYDYEYDDGTPIPSTPCDRLFHELYHVYEIRHHINDESECGDTGIRVAEVNATRAQNQLREAMGLPPRTHYGENHLPPGYSCDEEETPPPPPPRFGCSMSCSSSWGEPHLKTFDQRSYDFQAVGEFVGARDPAGDFEIQMRQEPWSTSRYVSLNSAIAMRVGGQKVEMRRQDFNLKLLIDGKEAPFQNQKLQDGDIKIDKHDFVQVTWKDGSTAAVEVINTFGIDLYIRPADERKSKLVGILGNFNAEGDDDLFLQGTNTLVDPYFEQLYPKYADSWRVTNETSLFTYDTGKTTTSYTDRTFPEKYINPADLPNASIAEQFCKQQGITDQTLLSACTLDVGLSGRPEFAYSALQVQNAAKSGTFGGKTFNIVINKPGDEQKVEFAAKANEKVFIDLSESTLPGQCGNFRLVDPKQNTIAVGCQVGTQGFIDGTTLTIDGTYSVVLEAIPGATGKARIQVIMIKDQIAKITPDGKAVSINLDKPGEIAKLAFSGEKGKVYKLDITNATLPGQCGGYTIEDKNGSSVGNGCLADGQLSITTTPLPSAGDYAVVIDPADKTTGNAKVRLQIVK